jgi:hypothetical protein
MIAHEHQAAVIEPASEGVGRRMFRNAEEAVAAAPELRVDDDRRGSEHHRDACDGERHSDAGSHDTAASILRRTSGFVVLDYFF